MKRTIEYCDELVNDKSRTYYEIVKQIQIDAIDTTVKRCAEKAEIKDTKVNYTGVRAGGYYIVKEIDKQSILQIAEQLKKELE